MPLYLGVLPSTARGEGTPSKKVKYKYSLSPAHIRTDVPSTSPSALSILSPSLVCLGGCALCQAFDIPRCRRCYLRSLSTCTGHACMQPWTTRVKADSTCTTHDCIRITAPRSCDALAYPFSWFAGPAALKMYTARILSYSYWTPTRVA